MTAQQLPLHLSLRDDAIFDNFFSGNNTPLVSMLQQFVENASEQFIYCYGETGSGRTHLLQAVCHAAEKQSLFYLPLSHHHELSPAILDALESYDAICLDDIDHVMGHSAWEEALFYFYNRARDRGARLLFSATCPPQQLKCQLPDLKSRMTSALTLAITPLTDAEKITVLQLRAQARGLSLSEEVASYLLHHVSRKLSDLMAVLEKCDNMSLITKRKITVPFVKMVLET